MTTSNPRVSPHIIRLTPTPTPIKAFGKNNRIANKPPKRLEGNKCFQFHGYEHFLADCANRTTFSIRKVEDIQAIEEEEGEEEYEEDDHTLITLDVGVLLLI